MGSAHVCTRFSSLFDVPCVKINLTKSHITRKVGSRLTRKQTFNINELSFENWNTSKHVGHSRRMANFVSLSIKILISRFVVAGPTASVFWDGPITMKISHIFLLIQVYKKNAKRMNRKRENDLSNTSTTCSLHVIGIWHSIHSFIISKWEGKPSTFKNPLRGTQNYYWTFLFMYGFARFHKIFSANLLYAASKTYPSNLETTAAANSNVGTGRLGSSICCSHGYLPNPLLEFYPRRTRGKLPMLLLSRI